MAQPGTPANPLRIAIIGSGPSGFYAADHLQKQKSLTVEIDMFDRLPTPFGLVRGGVAPDHPKIKSVTKVYERIAQASGFRFFGNVLFGKDITLADLEQHYHAVIFAVGAQTDKRLNIPGEDLPGSFAATEFVGWYNGHPDYRHFSFDLNVENVVVIGVGNVAMDVTRILARTQAELDQTDIASYAQEALNHSQVKNIYVLGRRGAAQAAFTTPEIKELGEMEDADIIVAPSEAALDEYSKAYLSSPQVDTRDAKNIDVLTAYSKQTPAGKSKRIILRFLTSPVEILGTDRVEAIKIVKNEAYLSADGEIRSRPTDETEIIPAGLIFRSVGYRGVPLPDIPFDDKRGIIPGDKGRVRVSADSSETLTGQYVVGWMKRGPSGVIGTNKPDSVETVEQLLLDVQAEKLWTPVSDSHGIELLLNARGIAFVTFGDWLLLDRLEQERAAGTGHPRVKFNTIESMLEALATHKQPAAD